MELPDYPGSKMRIAQSIAITLAGAKTTYSLLGDLILEDKPQVVFTNVENSEDCEASNLRQIFDKWGSDKGSYHGYEQIYSNIIGSFPNSGLLVVEVGIGTNNTSVPSHMGKGGTPGASLRAWREIEKVKRVIGLDIDSQILFCEQNIETFYLNQTDQNSWKMLEDKIEKGSVDLFIDDGLHAPFANLNFLKFARKFVKPNGYLVIEDITEQSLPVWNLLLNAGLEGIELSLYKANHSYVLVGRISKQ